MNGILRAQKPLSQNQKTSALFDRLSAADIRDNAEQAIKALYDQSYQSSPQTQNIQAGDHALRRPGPGERFWQFRDYTPSDRPQDIDWRQSAKGDHVFVREKERRQAEQFGFWCSRHAAMFYSSDRAYLTKGDYAAILALGVCLLMTGQHDSVKAIDTDHMAGRSEKTLQSIQSHLAEPNDESSLSDLHFLSITKQMRIGLFSDFWDEIADIRPVMDSLCAQSLGGMLVQVIDPAELTLPYTGRCRFESPDQFEFEQIDHVGSVRKAYTARIERHQSDLNTLANDYGWPLITCQTDQPLEQNLHSIWTYLQNDSVAERAPTTLQEGR